MSGLWRELLMSLATVAMLATVWGVARDHIRHRRGRFHDDVLAVLLGLGGGTLVVVTDRPPIGFDPALYYGLALLAAYFGGARAGILSFAVILAADLIAYTPSPAQIILAAALGVVLLLHRRQIASGASSLDIALVALTAAASAFLAVALGIDLAAPSAGVLRALATMAAAFLITGLPGLLIWRDRERRQRERTGDFLRLAVATLPDCLNVKDLDGRFVVANPATAALLGQTDAEALIGKTDFDFFPHDIAQGFRADEVRALAALRSTETEQTVCRDNGETISLSTLKAPVFAPSGTLIGLITHNRDITQRKQLERELDESRKRLDDALRLMSQGLVMFDRDGRIVYCNQRYTELFPLTADLRHPGTPLTDIIRASLERGEIDDPPPAGMAAEIWHQHLSARLRRDGTRVFQNHQGIWLEATVRATTDGGCHIVVSDVTERKTAEAKLRASEERWNFALESAGQGVWDFDLRNNREYHSPAWKAMLGYADDELQDAPALWLDLMHPDDRAAALRANDDHLAGRTPVFEAEFRMRHKDGHWIWVLDRGKVIEMDEAGRALRAIGTHTDITASKQADAAIRASEARFRSLFELSPVGFALVDVASGRLVTHNPALAEMLDHVGDDSTILVLGDLFAAETALPPLAELAAAGRLAPIECDLRRGDGATLPVIVTGSTIVEQADAAQIMLVFQDISMRRGYEERLWQLANIDSLTGLPNRLQFNARLTDAIERSRRTGQSFAVAFFDLDNFKDVNDSFGHGAGDMLLTETAGRVRAVLRAGDTLARIGGDEFAAILEGIGEGDSARRPLQSMIAAINRPVEIGGAPRRFSTSIGVALFPGDANEPDTLMAHADIALYRAKQSGRNRYEFFRPELRAAVDERAARIGAVENALNDGRLDLAFEPIVIGHGSRCAGLAVRPVLRAHGGEPLSDAHVATALTDANIAETIGRLTRRGAIAAAASWHRAGIGCGRLRFNLLPADLRSDRFVDDLLASLAEHHLEAGAISLGIAGATLTERGASRVTTMLRRLHGLGIELVLADFGAGQTAIGLLRDLPFDRVDFEAALVARLESSPTDQAIVIGLVDLAHRLGIATGAGGVASQFSADFLIGLGCELLHGPLFSAPLDTAAVQLYLGRLVGAADDLDHIAEPQPPKLHARDAVA